MRPGVNLGNVPSIPHRLLVREEGQSEVHDSQDATPVGQTGDGQSGGRLKRLRHGKLL